MERVVFFDQRNLFGLTEPLHQQGHRGDGIAAVEQRVDDGNAGGAGERQVEKPEKKEEVKELMVALEKTLQQMKK